MEERFGSGDSLEIARFAETHAIAVAQYAAQQGDVLDRLMHAASPRQAFLPELLERLMVSDTLAERWQHLVRCFAELGADQLNYGVFELWQGTRAQAPVRFMSTMTPAWLDYYNTQRLDLSDVHAVAARANYLQPYAWGAASERILDVASMRSTQQRSEKAGLRASIHVPVHDPLQPLVAAGSFTIGSSRNEGDFFGALEGRWPELVAAVHTFHTLALGNIRLRELGGEKLTAREVECLSLIGHGLRIDGVGDALNLARSTIDLHLRNARRKLRSATLAEALGRAIATQQIRLS